VDPRDSIGGAASVSAHQRRTTQSYDLVAAEYLETTRDFSRGLEWVERFAAAVAPGALVADLGSGPGRDTFRPRAHGLDAFCLDLSLGMLRAGREEYPASRVQASMLRLPLRSASLAGVWANASLLHLSIAELRRALNEIHRVLAPAGHVHLTVKLGEGSEWETTRYDEPRWFQYWTGADLDRELHDAGFAPVHASEEDSTSSTWLVRLCRAE